MRITPQERLALGVTALLIAAGAGVRVVGSAPEPAEWIAPADTINGISLLRAQVEQGAEERRRAAEPLLPGERIDPNTAPAYELDRLPRVGPALAQRIVDRRDSLGPYRTLGDIDQVPGIGPSMFEQIAPYLALPPGPAGGRHAESAGGGRGATTVERIAINGADAGALQRLPGIGPALADRIIEWRRVNGRFRTMESLEEVPGIGPALRARLEPHIIID